MLISKLALYYIISSDLIASELGFAALQQAIAGGVTAIQLRDKHHSRNAVRDSALRLKSLLNPLNIPLIINDDVTLAQEVQADGVHLGQNDLSPEDARAILGDDKIIGLSVETVEQLHKANQLTCIDYIAASAVFPSTTKHDCVTYWGLAGLKTMAELSTHPVIAIGGINLENITAVIQHGAVGVAVSSVLDHHPLSTAQKLIKELSCVKAFNK